MCEKALFCANTRQADSAYGVICAKGDADVPLALASARCSDSLCCRHQTNMALKSPPNLRSFSASERPLHVVAAVIHGERRFLINGLNPLVTSRSSCCLVFKVFFSCFESCCPSVLAY